MQELRELARKLLADGSVKVVIGYEEGPHGVRPAFVTDAAQAERLIFDARCVQNLAAYLSPRRQHLRRLGRPAVVVKGCDARAVAGLVREAQLKREDVVLIGVRCGGVVRDPARAGAAEPLTAKTVADRCGVCAVRAPQLADHVVGPTPAEPPAPEGPAAREARVAGLEKAPAAERWAFWQAQLARCVRCHACREVCPMCFCERCVADKSRPQWLESSPHPRGNLAWQMTRVLHQAGRCVDCGECERACPVGIPLNLITRHVAKAVQQRYGHVATDDPTVAAPIGTFKTDDSQEFIL